MPEFFLPYAIDTDEAEQAWKAMLEGVASQAGGSVTEHRIFRLGYLHDGKHMEAEVGKPHPYAKEIDWESLEEVGEEEEVLVIFQRADGLFLVCTRSRGVTDGGPILVGAGEAYEVVYFDGFEP